MGTDRFTSEDLAPSLDHADVLEILKGVRDEVRAMISAARAEITLAVGEALEKKLDGKIKAAGDSLRQELAQARREADRSTYKLEKLIKAIPAPTVNVAAPSVTMQPAEVNVTVPKQEQPTIQVNVPKLDQPEVRVSVEAPQISVEAPTVNVAAPQVTVESPEIRIPELKQPEIKVEVPRRKITKTITYDSDGKPQTITEEEG